MKYIDLVGYKKIPRDYFTRMNPEKPEVMKVAKEYGKDFWDGDRKYGYGGYKYDGRWETLAQRLIDYYHLTDKSWILDIGCGKGYLLYEIKQLLPNIKICGLDISEYAINNAREEVKPYLLIGGATGITSRFYNKQFDLVTSIGTLHNLPIYDLKEVIRGLELIAKEKYVTMESFRNDKERTNLFCWALTAESYFSDKEWKWILEEFGYTGDYGLFFFE